MKNISKSARKTVFVCMASMFMALLLLMPIFSQNIQSLKKDKKPAVKINPQPKGGKSVPAVAQPAKQNAPSNVKYKNIGLKADHMRFNNKTKNLLAESNVVLTMKEKDGDMKILCEKLLYNTEAETAKITGSPVFTQPGSQITGDIMTASFKEKKLHIEGSVQVVQEKKAIKKQTGFKEQMKDKMTLTCDKIDYDYGNKTGKSEGNIKVVQEEATPEGYKVHSTAYGDKADYNGKDEILVVTGRVKIEQKEGEWLNAQKATISLKEDWVEVEGNIEGNFKIEEEKVPDTKF